jgi:hypothetical protein
MAITLRTFASGDTDYIAKLNANVSAIKAAIDALQGQAGAAGGVNEITVGTFWNALFNNADTLIGPDSYWPTQGSSTVNVAPGAMYLATTFTPVQKTTLTTLNFSGQTPGTYYITISSTGLPTFSSVFGSGAAYSVEYAGGSFEGLPIRIAQVLFDAAESTAARESLTLGEVESPESGEKIFRTLDDRLESAEELAAEAKVNADEALRLVYEAGIALEGAIRKVGCTVDGTVGVKGAIQIDFEGDIIGWSIISDVAGSIEVEVSVAASVDPPFVPTIPDPVADKISASAPVALVSAQSAARDEAGVETWDVHVTKWSVLQFKVASVGVINRATLYLRIRETLPVLFTVSPPELPEFPEIPTEPSPPEE